MKTSREGRWRRTLALPRRVLWGLATAMVLACVSISTSSAQPPITLTNKLADAASPYLREAAGQPVHWQPWGEEAFRLARELDRPILMDIGAIWCHWCHVMDEETYSNPEVAYRDRPPPALNGLVPFQLDKPRSLFQGTRRPCLGGRYCRGLTVGAQSPPA